MDGVIHGSRTNHPPKLTPRTFSLPKSNFSESPRRTLDIRPAGRELPREASRATVATAELENLKETMSATLRVKMRKMGMLD